MSFDLEIRVDYNRYFTLIGLISSAKEYKLAWYLNRKLGINLVKSEDLVINFATQPAIIVSNFIFTTTHCTFRLIKNLSDAEREPLFLLPEKKDIDFFLMINDESDTFEVSDLIHPLSEIPLIESYQIINFDKLTNQENLIF